MGLDQLSGVWTCLGTQTDPSNSAFGFHPSSSFTDRSQVCSWESVFFNEWPRHWSAAALDPVSKNNSPNLGKVPWRYRKPKDAGTWTQVAGVFWSFFFPFCTFPGKIVYKVLSLMLVVIPSEFGRISSFAPGRASEGLSLMVQKPGHNG